MNFTNTTKVELINKYSYKGVTTRIILFNLIYLYSGAVIINSEYKLYVNNNVIQEYIIQLLVLNYNFDTNKICNKYITIRSNIFFKDYNNYIKKSRINSKYIIENRYKRLILCSIYLVYGTIINPTKDYKVEFRKLDEFSKLVLKEILGHYDLKLKSVLYRNKNLFYLSGYNALIIFLNLLGLYSAQLRVEDFKIIKDLRNNINRQVNGETANLNKTVNYASKQIIAIKKIGIENLPTKLIEVAKLRMKYPDASLTELEYLFNSLSKSGIRHRLNKIVLLAENK